MPTLTLACCMPDPEAADLVFGCEANIRVVGLDVTHACQFTAGDLQGLAGHGRFGTFLQQITGFYLQYHRRAARRAAAISLTLSCGRQAGASLHAACMPAVAHPGRRRPDAGT